MVKTINIQVTYKNQKQLIVCERHEIANKIGTTFGINLKDFVMFDKGSEKEVSPSQITDFMHIHMIPNMNGDGQQTLDAYLEADSVSKKTVASIISKLRHNTTLSGDERKIMIEAFEFHDTAIFKKRKLTEANADQPAEKKRSKKVQVNIPATNTKDSFAQTDPFKFPEKRVNNEEDAILKLKRLCTLENKPINEINSLMKETFNERRNYICVKCPAVRVIKERYPALFSVDQVKSELDRIFYPGKCEEFLSNMKKYYKYILHYGDVVDINDKTKKAMDHACTSVEKTYAGMVGSIFVLSKLLEEDFGFIHLSDYPHGSTDVYPHIDASGRSLKTIFVDEITFDIMVEGDCLCQAPNFPEAILCLVATFFIFNIDYPLSCRRTLTVLEKLYLKGNDTVDIDDHTMQMIKMIELRANEDAPPKKRSKK